MTQTGYTNAIVNAMLGWLKGLASWVLKLFNLSGGFSPLRFLADNWLQILIILLIAGVALDLLVWLIRWRPHWVWFRKKRVIINDKNFFADEKYMDPDEDEDEWAVPARQASGARRIKPRRNWEDSEFVVPGARRHKREIQARERRNSHVKSMQMDPANAQSTDIFQDGLFNVNAKQKFSDKYEDEVFSVSNLPKPDRSPQSSRRPRNAGTRPAQRSRGKSTREKR